MRHTASAGVLVCVLALTAACGSDEAADDTPAAPSAGETTTATESEEPTPTASESSTPEKSATPSPEPEPEGTVIEMTLAGGQVTPAGDRVEAEAGEPITFLIDADAAGELHVHSTPESEIAFTTGTSRHEIVIDQPGVVEVELHEPALVVVQLEVR